MNLYLRRKVMDTTDEKLIYLGRNLVCDGTNCFDTGFAPFSSDNINKDFKITFRMSSFGTVSGSGNQETAFACKYEDGSLGGQSYPGFTVRRNNNNVGTLQIGGYNYWTLNISSVLGNTLYLWRTSGNYYAQIGNGTITTLSVRSTTFDHTILLGATRNASDDKMRYGNVVIDYVRIEYL